MRKSCRWPVSGIFLLVALVGGGGTIPAQVPDEFTNLKVLPKEIGKRELVSLMREYAGALGVRCNFCHVGENPDSLEGYDFASDEEEHKRVTRAMMQMTREINQRLLPATGRKKLVEVRCVTCHRGIAEPESLDRMLNETIETEGVDGAIRLYREMREQHYGTGAYDFSAATLNVVAERLARAQNLDGAIALTRLNLEFHPQEAGGHLMLAQLHGAKGDKEAALASVKQALQLEPDNSWAQRLLERLRAPE